MKLYLGARRCGKGVEINTKKRWMRTSFIKEGMRSQVEAERVVKLNTPRVPGFLGWGVGATLSRC